MFGLAAADLVFGPQYDLLFDRHNLERPLARAYQPQVRVLQSIFRSLLQSTCPRILPNAGWAFVVHNGEPGERGDD